MLTGNFNKYNKNENQIIYSNLKFVIKPKFDFKQYFIWSEGFNRNHIIKRSIFLDVRLKQEYKILERF